MTSTTRFRLKLALALGLVATAAYGVTDRVIINPESGGDLVLKTNVGGTVYDALRIQGASGAPLFGSTSLGDTTSTFQSGAGVTVKATTAANSSPAFELNRTANTASRWQTYLPTGSTAWNLWNSVNSDVFTVSNAGAATLGPVGGVSTYHLSYGNIVSRLTNASGTGSFTGRTAVFLNANQYLDSGGTSRAVASSAGTAYLLLTNSTAADTTSVFSFKRNVTSQTADATITGSDVETLKGTADGAWAIGSAGSTTASHLMQGTVADFAVKITNSRGSASTDKGLSVTTSTTASASILQLVNSAQQWWNISGLGVITQNNYVNCTGFTSNGGGVLACTTSDERLKNAVEKPVEGLATVRALRPRWYTWKDAETYGAGMRGPQLGLYAQEVAKAIPTAVTKHRDGFYGYDERPVIAANVKATQELADRVDRDEREIAELKTMVRVLSARVDALETAQ